MIFILFLTLLFQSQEKFFDNRAEIEWSNLPGESLAYTYDIDTRALYRYSMKTGELSKVDSLGNITIIDTLNYADIGLTDINYQDEIDTIIFVDGGLGRVGYYDVNNKNFKWVDNSYPLRAFHGSTLYSSFNTILAIGGNGEFSTNRKNLLQFNRYGRGEWWELEITNSNIFDKNYISLALNYVMGAQNKKGGYYYFEYSQNEETLKAYSLNPINESNTIYTAKLINEIIIDLKQELTRAFAFTNHRSSEGLINITSSLFFDVNENAFATWSFEQNEKIAHVLFSENQPNLITYFYWDFDELGNEFLTFDFLNRDELVLKFTHKSIFSNYTKNLIILSLLLLAFFTLIIRYKRSEKNRINHKEFTIVANERNCIVNYNKTTYRFIEPIHCKILSLVSKLIEENHNEIEVSEFDKIIFDSNMAASHVSRLRNSSIKEINSKLGFDFINLRKAVTDKRRKIIFIRILN